jgi:metal-dependent hydrolase (beta-lactamase superfamily II)
VDRIAPGHCTGDLAFAAIQKINTGRFPRLSSRTFT